MEIKINWSSLIKKILVIIFFWVVLTFGILALPQENNNQSKLDRSV